MILSELDAHHTSCQFVSVISESKVTTATYGISAGPTTQLTQKQTDDSILIQDGGFTLGVIPPAWALDAAGKKLQTSYAIHGGNIVQTTSLSNAQLPVATDFTVIAYDQTHPSPLYPSGSGGISAQLKPHGS